MVYCTSIFQCLLWWCMNFVFPSHTRGEQEPSLKFVNPLIGTAELGHVFAGATLPYGMAKAVADVSDNNRGGFAWDGHKVIGFSHMHDSGVGGGSSMGNFPLFPYPGCRKNNPKNCGPLFKGGRGVGFKKSSVKATPGYFSIQLDSGVTGEATTGAHTALYRFTFPQHPDVKHADLKPLIILDLSDLYNSIKRGWMEINPDTGRMKGNGVFAPSFGLGQYTSYFCADFAGADMLSNGIWSFPNGTDKHTYSLQRDRKHAGGGFIHFDKPHKARQIHARVGLSFISSDRACSNAEKEIPNFEGSFDNVHSAARKAWSDKLSVIKVDPSRVSDKIQETFWSGIYRSMISPQDYTDENPLWHSSEPYFDSYYCIWDSFRSTHPFLTILDPKVLTKMVRSLIDIFVHEGYLPDCRMQLSKGYTQGGSNAEVVLTDSYLKGISHGVDWDVAYKGMIHDAEVQPNDWLVEGRGHLENYKSLGYIPKDDNGGGSGLGGSTISRTVEYAYDDFCIAQMAKAMGKDDDYKKYIKRSNNWQNLFNENQTSKLDGKDTGFVGFLQPRLMNGTFVYQNPTRGAPANWHNCCGMFSKNVETYEGSCWMYTFYAPGDMASLIKTLGGRKRFVERLQFMHYHGLVDIGNEQSLLTLFLYHYAGRPGLSGRVVRDYISGTFNTSPGGLPGNDDGGALGSFLAWSMIGLFPNPGQNVYMILPPYFPSISITNGITRKTATIKALNFEAEGRNMYIQSATLNGKRYEKNWLDHDFFLKGGTLELTLGSKESEWGQAEEHVPPSLSTTGFHPGVR